MYWSRQKPMWYGSLLCLLILLGLQGRIEAQGGPRAIGRGLPAPPALPAPGSPAAVQPQQPPQPLSPDTKITLDQSGLSVDVQEQDLPSVIERIATLGQIEIRHPEGIPNRRVTIRFSSLPVVEGLRRLFRVADVPGYMLVTAQDKSQVRRIVFLQEEGTGAGRGAQHTPPVAAQLPPMLPPTPPPVEPSSNTNVFDDIKANAAARRLLSQMMHPNDQVRERAFEGIVRLVREESKQRTLMEFLEPIMDDLRSEDQATQEAAREEIRKLLTR